MLANIVMQHAIIAGILIASTCGFISVMVIIRRTSFAAHSLGHMSLTGASLAILLNIPLIYGQLLINGIAVIIIGLIGNQIKKYDLAVGMVLTFILALGSYFLFLLQNSYAGGIMSILFGNILAISTTQIYQLSILTFIVIFVLMVIYRPLIFASIDPVIANSKNVPIKILSIIFLLLLAITVSMACQIVGTLLIFTLLIIPGAIGQQWGKSILMVTIISIIVANISFILGLYIAYYCDLPVSFCLTTLLCMLYLVGLTKRVI
jgi:zinc/manganese transport system permease protein